jgi:Ca-activated chloride channel family protein
MRSALALAFVVAAASAAAAQDVIPWPHRDGLKPITLSSQTLDIKIRDQAADVTMNAVFQNQNDMELEGMFFMNLPASAQVSRLSMTVNGKEMQAELLDSRKAREIYDKIVNARRDPALLEMVGQQMVKLSVYPVPARGEVKIQLGYQQVLAQDGGLVGLTAPFARNTTGDRPVASVVLNVSIESKVAIKTVYSPSHPVDVVKKSDHAAKASFEAKNYAGKQDFVLYYALSDDDLGLNLLTFREDGENGFFILMAAPKVAVDKIVPKDVVFVVDRSGSMAGEKIKQAREALVLCLNALNPGDRFNIVDFGSDVATYAPALVDAAVERAKAIRFAEGLQPKGSTNIDGALKEAFKQVEINPKRLQMVLFMTDGLPTVGEQNTDRIVENAKAAAGKDVRVFVFGVGNDINTQFLDKLAEQGRGARDYVAPEEKIEAKVSALFEKISHPALANIALDLGGAQAIDVYPKQMPDLFKGQQLTIYGRFKASGATAISLKGIAGGEEKAFRYEVNFPAKDLKSDFIPRLWAGRKIAFLLDGVRMGASPDKEVLEEIVTLSKRYGIVTPYTSYLITEDGALGAGGGAQGFGDRAREELRKLADKAAESGKGGANAPAPAEAQKDSKELEAKKKADGALYAADADHNEAADAVARRGGKVVKMKSVGSRTFYCRGGVWTDGAYDEKDKDKIVKVKFLGDDYKKLIEENPELAKYLSVGDSVIVCFGGKIYQVEK